MLHTKGLIVLLAFATSNISQVRFSALIAVKNTFRNRLKLSNSPRIKISNIRTDVQVQYQYPIKKKTDVKYQQKRQHKLT